MASEFAYVLAYPLCLQIPDAMNGNFGHVLPPDSNKLLDGTAREIYY